MENHENHICCSPNISPICEEDSFLLEDTLIESHENHVSPSPNASLTWEDIIEQNYATICKQENNSLFSLDVSPTWNEISYKIQPQNVIKILFAPLLKTLLL